MDIEVDTWALGAGLASAGAMTPGLPEAEGFLNLMLSDVGTVLDEVAEGEN